MRQCDTCRIVNCPVLRIRLDPSLIPSDMTAEEVRDEMCKDLFTEKGTE